jgi:hypothetical protein
MKNLILIVEDEAHIKYIIKFAFMRIINYKVDKIKSGEKYD